MKWRYIDRDCKDLKKFGLILNLIILIFNMVWSYTFESMLLFEPIYLILNIIIPIIILYVKYYKEYYRLRIITLHIITMVIPLLPLLLYTLHSVFKEYPILIVLITQLAHIIDTLYSSQQPRGENETMSGTTFFTQMFTLYLYVIYYDKSKFKELWIITLITSFILLLSLYHYNDQIMESLMGIKNIKKRINKGGGSESKEDVGVSNDMKIRSTHIMWVIKIFISTIFIISNINK